MSDILAIFEPVVHQIGSKYRIGGLGAVARFGGGVGGAQGGVKQEPWEGKRGLGGLFWGGGGVWGKGKIKEVTGGELGAMNPRPRTRRCIPKGKM